MTKHPDTRPTVILVCGLPGSGKSYFARKLSESINAAYFSSDVIRMRVLPQRTYSSQERAGIYDLMLAELTAALKQQQQVVVDATFARADLRAKFKECAHSSGAALAIIEVRAKLATIERRLSQARETSEADLAVYHKIKSEFEPIEEDHLLLYSDDEARERERIQEAQQYLENLT